MADPIYRKPNIIFILADDLGYGDLGCFGQKEIQTPNLDALAAGGIRLTDHYAGSTVCAPSRCCLMTGLHTGHALVRGNANVALRTKDTTVARLLKEAGYTTALSGKWGLGEEGSTGIPTRQGFDFFFGYLSQVHAHNYYPEWLWRNEEKVPLRNQVVRPKNNPDSLGGVSSNKLDYSHDLIAGQALRFVENHKDDPFFLYLAFTIPHANNEAGSAGMEVPEYGIYKDKDWPEPQKGHAAMISRMDGDVGRLVRLLRKLGIEQDTLIVFSSDNGPHQEGGNDPVFQNSNGLLSGIKRHLYEGGIRVPTIAYWPGKIRAGTASDHISAFWDFLPTACEAAGIRPPDGIDGISYLPTLLGNKADQKEHAFLYWEFHEGGSAQAVRMGKWKGVRYGSQGKLELYDLSRDMAEEKDVANENPDSVKKIEACMAAARSESEHWKLEKTGRKRPRM
ncbi:MAG: arylsulfatase [Sedimentisphaerales bacterium]|nr:arylsulfatase [Sedimentisphaerales bacterium]